MKIQSHAKVNLYLDITAKRADGYHELITLMCPIGLCDTITLSFDAPGISVACKHRDVPDDEENVAHMAARRFFRSAGIENRGVQIDIEKNIPAGSGLGGGSSNAAAVLTALNTHFFSPFSKTELLSIAETIGADVPFFIYNTPAVATGIGENITPFYGLRAFPLILISPAQALPTREVYKNFNLGLTKRKKIHTKCIFGLDWRGNAHRLLYNALEPAAFKLCPPIEKAKKMLLASGAAGALMTGSGSSVYGMYRDPESAKKAFDILSQQLRNKWQIFYTHLLVQHAKNGQGP